MRRVIAFIILLIHINTSMFIPVIDEVDMFDAQGNQVGDINTLVEFVDQVVLGHKPKLHPDSDDDSAHFFNIIKIQSFVINPIVIYEGRPMPVAYKETIYPAVREEKIFPMSYDVIAPPPKC